ncbi:unnamed protein product [Peniophora sp. CBMAI 1063]|nr:unnamed protein product [Peniophora sp. CBMAI 1063]
MNDSSLPPEMEARMAKLGEMAANDLIQVTVDSYRERGLFTPDKLYTMTVEEANSEDRVRFLMHIWTTLHERLPKDESEHIKYEFSTKYLSALADKWRDPDVSPITAQAISVSVGRVFETEVFTVWLQSKSARGLVAQQTKLMVNSPIGVSRPDVGQMSRTLVLLLLGQGCDDVDTQLKKDVISRLQDWVKEFEDFPAAENCASCLWLLTGSSEPEPDLISDVKECLALRINTQGCWHCNVVGQPLFKCSRCKYALYCCPEHQKKGWKSHKPWCYPSNF